MVDVPNDGLVGLASIKSRKLFGKMPNEKHQTARGFMDGASFELAIVEFDDQGRCYDRGQMDGVARRLDELKEGGKDAILLVFVHGWKHDARTDDENLSQFRIILATAVVQEARLSAGKTPRPVLGVFVGWRGLSEFGLVDAVADATFWGRQAAGQRVATGSVRELFGRLRTYRNDRQDAEGATWLGIAGHSFGGMIVFSALAQSLIEAASTPKGGVVPVPGFADLVLLINPAIEAARFLPIYDLVKSADFEARTTIQLPIFICAQAENDQPVGTWFPLGNIAHALEQETTDDLEKQCVTYALGFVEDFRTHRLTGSAAGKPFALLPSKGGSKNPSPGDIHQTNPFWIVAADKEVLDGHGGIWQRPFLLFLAGILFQHFDGVSKMVAGGSAAAQAQIAPGMSGDLAAFAQTLEELFPR